MLILLIIIIIVLQIRHLCDSAFYMVQICVSDKAQGWFPLGLKLVVHTCQPHAEDFLDVMTNFPGFNEISLDNMRPLAVSWRLTKCTKLRSSYHTNLQIIIFDHALL